MVLGQPVASAEVLDPSQSAFLFAERFSSLSHTPAVDDAASVSPASALRELRKR
jgi:hypothetical protein